MYYDDGLIKSNMRCIETVETSAVNLCLDQIKSNMRCIETDIAF